MGGDAVVEPIKGEALKKTLGDANRDREALVPDNGESLREALGLTRTH